MKFAPGTKVRYGGMVIGTVAGLTDLYKYGNNLYTIVIDNPETVKLPGQPWFWDSWMSGGHPLEGVCRGKYCYNIREKWLERAKTKLGNEL